VCVCVYMCVCMCVCVYVCVYVCVCEFMIPTGIRMNMEQTVRTTAML